MLRRPHLRVIVLACLQLLPKQRQPLARQRLAQLKQRLFPQTRQQMATIARSGLWDEAWFCQRYPDFAAQGKPLHQFVSLACEHALSPHPLFDSAYYLKQNTDVKTLGINPLYHYLSMGHREGRQPNPLFSDNWYREQYPDVADYNASALQHYLLFGDAEGRDPHPLLKARWYREQHKLPIGPQSALEHYLHQGEMSGLRPNAWFDPHGYAENMLAPVDDGLLAHFFRHGAVAGVDPSSDFSLHEYCDEHPEVNELGINPLVHFLSSGRSKQSRRPPLELDAQSWNALFGRLTQNEHALLQQHFPAHGQANVLLIHSGEQPPQVIRCGNSQLHICMTRDHAAQGTNPQQYDAIALCSRSTRVFEDALLAGVDWIRDGKTDAVYFDQLTLTEQAQLDFKPDWSPAKYRAGQLDLPLLLLNSDVIGVDELQRAPGTWIHNQLVQGHLKPMHIPLLATETETASMPAATPAPRPQKWPLVSIIIPSKDQLPFLRACIDSLCQQTDYPHWEIILVDNGSEEPETREYLAALAKDARIKIKPWPHPFNFSQLCNVGAELASGEFICLLNNDVEIIQTDWLTRLLTAALEADCGAVGPLLQYPDERIQSAGVLMGPGGVAANRYATVALEKVPAAKLDHVHEVSAVAGACLLTPTAVYRQLGGLNEAELGVAFNDVDYCLRVREAGLYCRLEPRARLLHHESVSLKDHAQGRALAFSQEVQWMQHRWQQAIARDPFHNINLNCSKFRPHDALFRNQRNLFWREHGLCPAKAPSCADLHPPLRWYVDNNQSRVADIRQQPRLAAVPQQQASTINGLAILILTKDRPEYIIPLLRDLIAAKPAFDKRQLELKILIGDTGSSDAKVLNFYQDLPECCQLVSGLEYQFSRCNNQLLDQAQAYQAVLFLNNDIAFRNAAHSLLKLWEELHNADDTGIVGAVLQFPNGRIQHQGIAAIEHGSLRGFVHHPGAGERITLAEGETQTCLAVTGALLLMRTAAARAIAGFDEAYQAECQDVDLCLAAARAGYRSRLLNAGKIIHYENGTREPGEENWRDRRRLMRRWHHWIEEYWLCA